MLQRFYQSSSCLARTAFCCKRTFTDPAVEGRLKIREIEQTMDVLGFAAHFKVLHESFTRGTQLRKDWYS